MISPLRFFIVSPLHSRYMWVAMLAVLLWGAAMLCVDPAKGAHVLGPLALLQTLAASSGFAVAARRGHLDLLLTAGASRHAVALTHLAVSVLPGLLVWCTLGMVEIVVGRTMRPLAFTSGSAVALCAASVLAWALTVHLPRFGGGIAWLLGIAMYVVGWSDGAALTAGAGEEGGLTRAFVVTMCPFVLLGRRLSAHDVLVAAPIVALAALLTAGAVVAIVRMDVPLESAQ